MTTTKSYSKPGRGRLYLSTLRRQLPFAIVTTIIVFGFMALPYLVNAPDHLYWSNTGWNADALRAYYTGQFQHGVYMEGSLSGVVGVMLAIMAFVSALSSGRYLHSKKMTDLYHALPVRREHLLLTNLAASITAIFGPYLVLTAGTVIGQLLVYGRYGCFGLPYMQYILSDILLTGLYLLVVYLLTTLVAVNVGTVLDALMVTGVVGFLPSIVYVTGGFTFEMLYFGSNFSGGKFLMLNPFLFFMQRYFYQTDVRVPFTQDGMHLFSTWKLQVDYGKISLLFVGWLIVAVLLLVGAMLCYRRRRSEIAGQTQPQGVFQMITKCFACYVGAFIFMAIFVGRSLPARLFAMLIGGVCIGLVAELLLSRSLKFLRRNLIWLAITGVVCCAAYLCMYFDVTGYIRRVPAVNQVASVELTYSGRYSSQIEVYSDLRSYGYSGYYGSMPVTLTDPDAISLVCDVHARTVAGRRAGDWMNYYNDDMIYGQFSVRYKLRSGGTLERSYYQIEGDALPSLLELETSGDYLAQTHPLFVMDKNLSGAQSSYINEVSYVDRFGQTRTLPIRGEELDALIEAMKQDALNQPSGAAEGLKGTRGFVRLRYTDQFDAKIWLHGNTVWVELGDWTANTLPLLRAQGVELGAEDPSRLEGVYLAEPQTLYEYVSSNSVVTIYPDQYYAYNSRIAQMRAEGSATGLMAVTDEAQILEILDAGVATALLTWKDLDHVVVVLYDYGDETPAVQLVRIADLPAQLRAQAAGLYEEYYDQYYNDEYGYYDYYDYAYEIAEENYLYS